MRNEDGSISFDAVTVDDHLCTAYVVSTAGGESVGCEISGPDTGGRMTAYNLTANAAGHALAVRAAAFWHVSGQQYPEGEAVIVP